MNLELINQYALSAGVSITLLIYAVMLLLVAHDALLSYAYVATGHTLPTPLPTRLRLARLIMPLILAVPVAMFWRALTGKDMSRPGLFKPAEYANDLGIDVAIFPAYIPVSPSLFLILFYGFRAVCALGLCLLVWGMLQT